MSLELTRFEAQCLTEYFLHRMGYTYDGGRGNLHALTNREIDRLWQGLALWHEYIENYDRDESPEGIDGTARTAGKMDADTQRKWQQFSQQVEA